MDSHRIPAKQSTAFQPWSPPDVDEGVVIQPESKAVEAQQKLEKKKKSRGRNFTAQELEQIAQDAYDEGKELGYNEGFASGKDAGYQQGLKTAERDVKQQVAQLQKVVAGLQEPLLDEREAVIEALVNLALRVCESVLGKAFQAGAGAETLQQIIAEAAEQLPFGARNVSLYLSEKDFDSFQTHGEIPASWAVHSDSAMAPGGCRLETQQSTIDFSAGERFKQVVESISASYPLSDVTLLAEKRTEQNAESTRVDGEPSDDSDAE